MLAAHRQLDYALRFDWGLPGAEATVMEAAVAVVVDVLSFTTMVSVAIDAGIEVLPYPWNDGGAQNYASQRGATLAVDRLRAGAGDISLSPQSLRTASPPARLVLPSPNGSTMAYHVGDRAPICLAACLRNAASVAAWIAGRAPGVVVTVIGAGERWGDGSLRPAIEDLWGAGAVICDLLDAGWTSLSPEAELARVGYESIRGRERSSLAASVSGRELADKGFSTDVEIAAESNVSSAVPILVERCFGRAEGP
jgi:2-phosphosulfolactate phosphatase